MGMGNTGKPFKLVLILTLVLTFFLTTTAIAKNTGAKTDNPKATADETETAPTPSDTQTESDPAATEETPAEPIAPETLKSKKAATSAFTGASSTMSTMSASSAATGDPTDPSYQTAPMPEISVFTGAANYKIPIKVPPGRNGMTPDINLVYNSYLKTGPPII